MRTIGPEIQGASAAVKAAKATLEPATVNLGFTKLYSPIDAFAATHKFRSAIL